VRPEGLGKLKQFTSSGLEPATFRLAAYSLNHYATDVGKIGMEDQYENIHLGGFCLVVTYPLQHAIYMKLRCVSLPQNSLVLQKTVYIAYTADLITSLNFY
jgi:hypothetical protein